MSNWRPIRTAPKDEQILLAYTGGDGETRYSGMGRWVEVIRLQHAQRLAGDGKPVPTEVEGRWMIGYIAIIETSGAHNYMSFEPRDWTPYDVTHWMPLPAPTKFKR